MIKNTLNVKLPADVESFFVVLINAMKGSNIEVLSTDYDVPMFIDKAGILYFLVNDKSSKEEYHLDFEMHQMSRIKELGSIEALREELIQQREEMKKQYTDKNVDL